MLWVNSIIMRHNYFTLNVEITPIHVDTKILIL